MKLRAKLLLTALIALLLLNVAAVALAEEPPQPAQRPAVQGRVETKSEDGFTLSTRQGEVAASVDPNTRYRIPGVEKPKLADIQVGDVVLVFSRRDEAGKLLARMVVVLPPVPISGLKGQVKTIEGQTLTVTARGGDKEVLTDEHTQYRVPNVEHPTLADIHVGDRLFALVEAGEGGTLLAKMVAVLPEGKPGPISLRGRVGSVAESSLTVKVHEDVATVTITATTQIRVPGVEYPTLSSIRVGDWVLVIGRPTGLCRVEAMAIGVLPPVSPQRFAVRGEVKSIEGTTLLLEDNKGTHTVLSDDQTRFRVPGVEKPSIADIHVGDRILAVGKPVEGDASLARAIVVRRPPEPESEVPEKEVPDIPPPF